MATPVPAPVTISFLNFLQRISLQSIEAEVQTVEHYAPFALALLPSDVRSKVAAAATFIIGLCLSLGGTVPGAPSGPVA
jgi:hypothetical protein